MIVFIPTAHCLLNKIPMNILEGITDQGCLPYIVSSKEYAEYRSDRYKIIAGLRKEIIELAKEMGEEYIAMSNSDILHKKENFKDMENFLKENKDFAGVALTNKSSEVKLEPDHVNLFCTVLRRECLDDIDTTIINRECDCMPISRSLKKKWRYGFLENTNNDRIEHRHI